MRASLSSRGFSLIELVTVLIIIGALSVFALPRFADQQVFAARGYFDQLIQATRYAQKLAVATHCDVTITINANSFSLSAPASAGCAAIPSIALPGTAPPYTVPSPDVAVTAGTGAITFHPFGNASATPTVVVNGTLSFTVHAGTGYVERL